MTRCVADSPKDKNDPKGPPRLRCGYGARASKCTVDAQWKCEMCGTTSRRRRRTPQGGDVERSLPHEEEETVRSGPSSSVITYSHFGREARIILKTAKPCVPIVTQKKRKRSPYDAHRHVVPHNCRTIVLPSNAQGAEGFVLPTFPIDVLPSERHIGADALAVKLRGTT